MAEGRTLRRNVVARALIMLIRVYQWMLSPLLGNICRFHPSCSRYAASCLGTHGALRGSWLAVRRLLRCHPFHPGGYDPPPLLPSCSSAESAGDADTDRATRLGTASGNGPG